MTIRISKKYEKFFSIMMDLGGKATTKQIFNLMSQDDREMFGIKEPRSIGKFFHLKNGMYVKRTVKTRGYIPQVWELKPRVVEYFEQQNVKE